MRMTKAKRLEITGGAIAHRLKDRGFTGTRLDRAIEEVADDMHGSDTIAGQTLVEIFDTSVRDWNVVRRNAKRSLRAMGRPS